MLYILYLYFVGLVLTNTCVMLCRLLCLKELSPLCLQRSIMYTLIYLAQGKYPFFSPYTVDLFVVIRILYAAFIG